MPPDIRTHMGSATQWKINLLNKKRYYLQNSVPWSKQEPSWHSFKCWMRNIVLGYGDSQTRCLILYLTYSKKIIKKYFLVMWSRLTTNQLVFLFFNGTPTDIFFNVRQTFVRLISPPSFELAKGYAASWSTEIIERRNSRIPVVVEGEFWNSFGL